jgi:hypothetical protein
MLVSPIDSACLLREHLPEEAIKELKESVRAASYFHHVSYEQHGIPDPEGGEQWKIE